MSLLKVIFLNFIWSSSTCAVTKLWSIVRLGISTLRQLFANNNPIAAKHQHQNRLRRRIKSYNNRFIRLVKNSIVQTDIWNQNSHQFGSGLGLLTQTQTQTHSTQHFNLLEPLHDPHFKILGLTTHLRPTFF